MTLRKRFFWLHLVAGLVAGLVIAIMSFTGAALAFEKEIIAWMERDARRVAVPSGAVSPLSLDALLERLQASNPGVRPSSIMISADPTVAITFAMGRDAAYYGNPFTGEIHRGDATRTRAFMRTMNAWHRALGVEGEHRNAARAVTGAGNAAFLLLAVTGLYLWWPRVWSRKTVRAIIAFNSNLHGKARDFNWHNVIGVWSAPVMIVVTATALPISYRWAGDLIYTLTGTAPASAAPVAPAPVPPAAADAKPLTRDALLTIAKNAVPTWQQMTVRLGSAAPAGATRGPREIRETRTAQVFTVAVKAAEAWPRTATTTLTLDQFTGAVLQREDFSSQNLGRQVRSWTRFLHTGEALGWLGQCVAGLASLASLVLVWTGFALAWRRFVPRRHRPNPPAAEPAEANAHVVSALE